MARARRTLPLALVLLSLGACAASWLRSHWGVEENDNAQLQTHLVEISSRVPGSIAQVPVQENQEVASGTPLVLLDRRDAVASLRRAEADHQEARRQAAALAAEASSSLSGGAAAADQAAADQQVAQAEVERSRSDLRRLEFLLRQEGVSRQEVDKARAAYQQALGQLTHSQATGLQAHASQAQVGGDRQKLAAAKARIGQAEAVLASARLHLGYQRILAPRAGRIGSLTAEPGRQVQPGQPLMTLVSADPWVEANFKETQLDALRPGQPAEINVDAFPSTTLHGHVLSVAPASGARFALLMPWAGAGSSSSTCPSGC